MRSTRRVATLLASLLLLLLGCRERRSPETTDRPQRIVSQTVLSDEILWDLGESVRSRVVGVSHMVDDTTYSSVPNTWPATVLRVPGSSEALVSVRPDLVVLAEFTAEETKALLAHAGVATLELRGFDGFDAFRRHVREVSEAVDARDEGAALVDRFDRALSTQGASTEPNGRTALSWVDGMVAGADTTFDDQARAAGLVNIAAREGIVGHRAVPIERITTWNPDIIVIPCHGDCEGSRQRAFATPGISATKAAREGAVLPIESHLLFSTGLGMVEVVKILRSGGRNG
jgi:iron complex transport system substrate-binding protein